MQGRREGSPERSDRPPDWNVHNRKRCPSEARHGFRISMKEVQVRISRQARASVDLPGEMTTEGRHRPGESTYARLPEPDQPTNRTCEGIG